METVRRKPTGDGIPFVINAAISQFVESANKGPSKSQPSTSDRDFLPASTFDGEKPGYYFGKDTKGLG